MRQTKILIAAIVLLTVLFIGLSWFAWASAKQMSVAIPILCTMLPILIGLGIFLTNHLLQRRAQAGLEKGLGVGEPVAPGASAEIVQMRQEFTRAVEAFKSSDLGKGRRGKNALAALPWYAIIGPPSCGKTTALRESGIRFPHLAGTGELPRVKGIGGTLNCDWFLTSEAILLDTAGRWTQDDREEHNREWQAFLQLLRKYRPHPPLNGVVVAVSLAEDPRNESSVDSLPSIASLGEREIQQLGHRMRTRLDEITKELGVRLPVYLLFTKCDLLNGFAEMFSDMSAREREQVWGFTAAVGSAEADPERYFAECFEELCRHLDQRALIRMSSEARPDVLERVFAFPAQLRALEPKLRLYVSEFMAHSPFHQSPVFRGAFFTCGTREGAPADVVGNKLAQELNLEEEPLDSEEHDESYFLHDMLVRIVFPDKNLATQSAAERRRRTTIRRVWTRSLLAASVLGLLATPISCAKNEQMLAQTQTLAARYDALVYDGTTPLSAAEMWPLHRELTAYEAGLPSPLFGFGLYQGDLVQDKLTEYYALQLRDKIILPLFDRNTHALQEPLAQRESVARRVEGYVQLPPKDRQSLLSALKLHLLLSRRIPTERKECSVPAPVTREGYVIKQMLELWAQADPAGDDDDELARRRALLTRYVQLLTKSSSEVDERLAMEIDEPKVRQARQTLGGKEGVGRSLLKVLERYRDAQSPELQDIQQRIMASRVLTTSSSVPGAFSRDVWRDVRAGGSTSTAFGASDADLTWTLGCENTGEAAADRDEKRRVDLLTRYLESYSGAWRKWLDGISAREPNTPEEAQSMLMELMQPSSPLEMIFRTVQQETTPPPPPKVPQQGDQKGKQLAQAGAALAKGKAKKLARAAGTMAEGEGGAARARLHPAERALSRDFSGFYNFGVAGSEGVVPALSSYKQQIQPVLQALEAYTRDRTQVEPLKNALQTAIPQVQLLIPAGNWQSRLSAMLLPPLEGMLKFIDIGTGAVLQDEWCSAVYGPYREHLAHRFPIAPSSRTGVSLQAYQDFFHPGSGQLWRFVDQQLGDYIDKQGQRFSFGTREGTFGATLLRRQLLEFLEQAYQASRMMFPDGAASPTIRFRARLGGASGIRQSTLKVGGQELTQGTGTDQWVSLTWPGSEPNEGATLAVVGDSGQTPPALVKSGPWGLFELIGLGARRVQGSELEVRWRSPLNLIVSADFSVDSTPSPLFDPRLLSIEVPARITHQGSSCR